MFEQMGDTPLPKVQLAPPPADAAEHVQDSCRPCTHGHPPLMSIGMNWGAYGHGQAYGEYPSVDACAGALCRSARRAYARLGPATGAPC